MIDESEKKTILALLLPPQLTGRMMEDAKKTIRTNKKLF
jgi:hypothetical protein